MDDLAAMLGRIVITAACVVAGSVLFGVLGLGLGGLLAAFGPWVVVVGAVVGGLVAMPLIARWFK
jgi:hypothetical protein